VVAASQRREQPGSTDQGLRSTSRRIGRCAAAGAAGRQAAHRWGARGHSWHSAADDDDDAVGAAVPGNDADPVALCALRESVRALLWKQRTCWRSCRERPA
jgi:hypothetical protein